MAGLDRDAFYTRLHELHDADPNPDPNRFFNEYEVAPLEQRARMAAAVHEARTARAIDDR